MRTTLKDIPRFASPAAAEAAGYRTIGDAVTGDEHYVNWSYVNDGKILDPQKPESLVYEWRNGKQSVVAAMYMLPFGSHFTDIPDVGGALTQWHVHRDLCLTDDPVQKVVAGLTSVDAKCPPGTEKAGDTPMLHVWIVPNPCGPFAALEGIGAGQVPPGQTRLCDTSTAEPRPACREQPALAWPRRRCDLGVAWIATGRYRLFRGRRHRRARGAPNGARTPASPRTNTVSSHFPAEQDARIARLWRRL